MSENTLKQWIRACRSGFGFFFLFLCLGVFEVQCAVNDAFTKDYFKFVVLSQEGTQGTVSVEGTGGFPSKVVIPETVIWKDITYTIVLVKNYGFYNRPAIESIEIPETVTRLGDYAFCECIHLKEIKIPSKVTSFGSYAFFGCRSLTRFVIPESVETVGINGFYGCINLREIQFSDRLRVEARCFDGCFNLPAMLLSTTGKTLLSYSNEPTATYCKVPEGVTTIATLAFRACRSLKRIDLPSTLVRIEKQAFQDCTGIERLLIPSSVSEIGSEVFANCYGLAAIDVQRDNPVYISDDGALLSRDGKELISCPSGKKDYTIPDSVVHLADSAFRNCRNLSLMEIPSSVSTIGARAFTSCTSLTNVVILDGVKEIGVEAFWGCTNLVKIAVPKSLKGGAGLSFRSCTKLESIEVHPDNPSYSSYQGVLFDKALTTLICCPTAKRGEYRVPEGVQVIAQNAFMDNNFLTNIVFSQSLQRIERGAIVRCFGFREMRIPQNVNFIEPVDTFSGCMNLNHLYFMGDAPKGGVDYTPPNGLTIHYFQGTKGWSQKWSNHPTLAMDPKQVILYAQQTYREVSEGQEFTFEVNTLRQEGLTYQWYRGEELLEGETHSVYRVASATKSDTGEYSVRVTNALGGSSVLGFSLEVGRTGDPDEYFKYIVYNSEVFISKYLVDKPVVNIPNLIEGFPVVQIRAGAFKNCSYIRKVLIPKSVRGIREQAFFGCVNLEEVELSYGLASIGDEAFNYCSKLKSLWIPATVTLLGKNIFFGCSRLETITIQDQNPNYMSRDGVLFNKEGSTLLRCPPSKRGEYKVPDEVKLIEKQAFRGCNLLKVVYVPDEVTQLGEKAFYGCSALKQIALGNGIQRIEGRTFEGCSSLETITIPKSVKFVGQEAFYDCYNLESAIFFCSGFQFDSYVFENCLQLKDLYFMGNAPHGGNQVFGRFPRKDLNVYHLEETTGWDKNLYGIPTQLWKPVSK